MRLLFIPPAGIILMTAPILLPIITAAGFDPVWFGVIVTINMEIGLITPPVGLNLFVVNAIAPDVPTKTVLWGSVPYVMMMIVAIIILSVFPGIATWLPDFMMGVAIGLNRTLHCSASCCRPSASAVAHLLDRGSRPARNSLFLVLNADMVWRNAACARRFQPPMSIESVFHANRRVEY